MLDPTAGAVRQIGPLENGGGPFCATVGYAGSLGPARPPRRPRAKAAVPAALQHGEPVAVASAVCRFARLMRAQRDPSDCLTLSMDDVLRGIGLVNLFGVRCPYCDPTGMVHATLLALGFVTGRRGKAWVYRLFRESELTASRSRAAWGRWPPCESKSLLPDRSAREHSASIQVPHELTLTQRRVAPEKRVKFGNADT